jgi:16S rRNA processing protein RimM
MTVEDCYQVGYIIKPHGLKGDVQIYLDVDDPKQYKNMESVFVLQGQSLVPFFLISMSLNRDKAIVNFEDIDTIEMAKALKGLELYMPLAALPQLEGEDFYYHEIQGFLLKDEKLGDLGTVSSVVDAGHQLLIAVAHDSGKEILIPLSDELIVSLDKKSKLIIMNVPEGLVDVYLNDES